MKGWVGRLITGIDNHTPDLARLLWLLMGLEFIGLAAWTVMFNHEHFDMVAFGTGAGLVLTAGGIAVAVKSKTEPPPKENSDVPTQ